MVAGIRSIVLAFLVVACLTMAGAAQTPSELIFGPQQYVRTTGSPNEQSKRRPSWTLSRNPLVLPRSQHTATLLLSRGHVGQVLIVGGSTGDGFRTAELYDPRTDSFVPAGNTELCHAEGATATRLLDGRVLIVGGVPEADCDIGDRAEIYDPYHNEFRLTGKVISPGRNFHTATLLPNGKVLIAGGKLSAGGPSEDSAELFDPAMEEFTETGRLHTSRLLHSATLLADKRGVLIIGGNHRPPGVSENCERSAEIYDPLTGMFSSAGNMTVPRCLLWSSQAPRLRNGNVLIAGGQSAPDVNLSSAELFDPVSQTFSRTGDMTTTRVNHTMTLLRNGKVLVAGGGGDPKGSRRSAEIYNPATRTFAGESLSNEDECSSNCMHDRRQNHTATRLLNGKVLVVGGVDTTIPGCEKGAIGPMCSPLDSAELFSR
jgi:hypothetical protein